MEVVGAVPGLVDTCLKLFDRLHGSYKKYEQLSQSVDSIRRELRAIREAIGTRSGTANRDGISSWIADLKEIWQRIEDSVDLYNFNVTGEPGRSGHLAQVVSYVKDALHLPDHRSTKLLHDIEEIRKLISEANTRVQNYRLPQVEAGEITVRNEEEAYRHPREANPIGLETPKAELFQMLSGGNGKLKVLAIYGPAGSGKSILAQAVYNQIILKQEFECKAWVTASHNVKNLLLDLLAELGFATPLPSKNLSQHLRDQLNKKRYIIGIDGLETLGYWNDVLHACPDDMSSIIIVTTTKEEIARGCHKNCPLPVYKMLPLDKSHARALLIRKAFGEDGCPHNLEEGLTMILETCEYQPLAITNMGDHMRMSVREWDNAMCVNACKKIGTLLVSNKEEAFLGMNHVLNRSYNSLNDNTRSCLLSLNTCDNDHDIKRKSLIRRWFAERLITCTHNQSAEHLANECFATLIEHNFILPIKFSICGHVKTFRVHRMMLQFIKDKAISENFVTWLDIHQGQRVEPHTNISRLYLQNNSIESPGIREAIDLSRVRLLTFHGKASRALMNLVNSKFLRVLVLENIEKLKDDDLDTICRPSMLKYLSIRGNKGVGKLPHNIINLHFLETLDTRDTNVHIIPLDVILLPELMHLFGEFHVLCTENNLKKFLSNKKVKLQILAGFFIDESPDFVKLLPHMPKLSKIRILCRQYAPSKEVTKDLLDSLKRCFEGELSKPNLPLRSLSIDSREVHDLNFLDNLEVPPACFLHFLKLRGKLTRLPKFILADSLKELCLTGSNLGGKVLLGLQSLLNLQFLKLSENCLEFEAGICNWRKGWFVNLKRLCFVVPKLPKIVIEEQAMKGLESLQIFCTELGGFSGIEHLVRLEELILPSNVNGKEVNDLSEQLSRHPKRPKLVRVRADTDGSIQSGRMLIRSERISKPETRE